jgi:hypothetical protein
MRILALTFLLAIATPLAAQEIAPPPPAEPTSTALSDADPHPILSADAAWAGALVIIILGTFLAAAVVGPIVRLEAPEAVPQAFSHHEDPSHHAGTEDDRPALPGADE